MEYGDIIEYIDGTFDPKFNEAEKWAQNNNADFVELLDKRTVLEEDEEHQEEVLVTKYKYDEDGNATGETYEEMETITKIYPAGSLKRYFEIKAPSVEKLQYQKKQERNALLADSDKYMLSDFPVSEEDKQKWVEYRQYLRDYTNGKKWWKESPKTFEEWK